MSFIDKFQDLVAQEATEIARRKAEEEERQLRWELGLLNREEKHERQKHEAITHRTETLNMAWVAAGLLKAAGVTPKHWLGTETIREKRGILRREQVVGTRDTLLLEGWPLLNWQYGQFQPFPTHTLVLTPDGISGQDSNLSYFTQNRNGLYASGDLAPLDPSDIHPIGREPLSENDMPWTTNWSAPHDGVQGPKDEVFIRSATSGGIPDYHKYEKLKIEQRVQRSIAHVAARYLTVADRNTIIEAGHTTNPTEL